MKKSAVVLSALVALALSALPASAGSIRLTMDFSSDLSPGSSPDQMDATFAMGGRPVAWGFGWEVVPRSKAGFGGDYMVSFSQDLLNGWWLDWYAPALYAGWHPLGPNRFVDPYGQVGIGCAGRVHLSDTTGMYVDPSLSLALFPFVGAGLNLNLDGLVIGARAIYTPYRMGIPATTIPTYNLGTFQVMITAGVSLGW